MLVGGIVAGHLVVLHRIIGRPVVLSGIDLPGLKGRVHIAVGRSLRHSAQQADHVGSNAGVLHADGLAFQICQCADGLAGVERPRSGVVPAQPHTALPAEHLQKLFAQISVQHPAHVGVIAVEVRQHQHIQLGQVIGQRRKRQPGKIDPAELQLLPHLVLGAVLAPGLDLNHHLAAGALTHKVGKIPCALCGRVILRLVFGIGQHKIRCDLRFAPAARQLQRQQPRPGQKCPSAHDKHPSLLG